VIGETLEHYRIDERLGAGGMGVVYRSYDRELRRPVALKILHESTDESAPARLLAEARAASSLNHPNICTVYGVSRSTSHRFIVMELVEGRTLAEIIPEGGLPVSTAVRYAVAIAGALGHAHARGIVHRDLKSLNVMIAEGGHPKVLDFGIATRTPEHAASDTTVFEPTVAEGHAGIAGTLAYLSPEALRGEEVDARSDLWAFGVLVHEMLTGRVPFTGVSGADLSSAILRDDVGPLPAHVPAALAGVVQRCLVKDPNERYQRADEVIAALQAVSQSAFDAAPAPAPARSDRSRLRLALAGVAATAAILAIAIWSSGRWSLSTAGPSMPRIQSLAVLPLENLSRDPEQAFFADGLTEALTTQLSKISALRVVSRAAAMQYKGVSRPMHDIARELDVDGLVGGSVLRSGGRVRITAHLVDGATDRNVWADSYERDLAETLTLQSEIARAITDQIRVTVTPDEHGRMAQARRIDPSALDAYLKGRFELGKSTVDGFRLGLQYFERAAEIDPGYAAAYSGIADAYMALGNYSALPPSGAFPPAKAAALQALALDDTLADAHASLGDVLHNYEWDQAGAEQAFRRAIALNPNAVSVRVLYESYLMKMGRFAEAEIQADRLKLLEPQAASMSMYFGYFRRQYDTAIRQWRQVVAQDPTSELGHFFLTRSYIASGRHAEAVGASDAALKIYGDRTGGVKFLALKGQALAGKGDRAGAMKVIDELERHRSREYVRPSIIAEVYASLNDNTRALEWLEKAVQEHDDWITWMKIEPSYDGLRADPRFRQLLNRIGFPPDSTSN
jgi:TolB-like protein/tRNA A-37 threonylcarbamoyl transferase component Bud32